MFKKLADKIFRKDSHKASSDGFFLNLQKEIFGVGCKNRIRVKMQFDSGKNLKSRQIENGEFIED